MIFKNDKARKDYLDTWRKWPVLVTVPELNLTVHEKTLPDGFRILAFDYVGADGSIDAPIDTADQADAVALLLDALGIDVLEAFVGYSYGALVGLQLAARHPQRLRKLIAVSGAHRAHPYAAACDS